MAYVVWRVFMKKYSKVRLGLLRGSISNVTPSVDQCTASESSWKINDDQCKSSEQISRGESCRQSKGKRVKNYLRKCKDAALGAAGRTNAPQNPKSSAWYVEKQGEVKELDDAFLETGPVVHFSKESDSAEILDIKRTGSFTSSRCNEDSLLIDDYNENAENSILLLPADVEPTPIDRTTKEDPLVESVFASETKHDVSSLVDRHFGGLYVNYARTKRTLVRQARDLLLCEFRGCLQKFEEEFCVPASKLLQFIKDESAGEEIVSPNGWPLCLGESGIVVHLGPLCETSVRPLDCYLCLQRDGQCIRLVLVYRTSEHRIESRILAGFESGVGAMMCTNGGTATTNMDFDQQQRQQQPLEQQQPQPTDGREDRLPELLQNLLVSVEHAIERVPLDELTFPCPQCMQYQPLDRAADDVDGAQDESSVEWCGSCSCQCYHKENNGQVQQQNANNNRKDTSIRTSPMFEFVNSIPHIDSDEDDDKESVKSGTSAKKTQDFYRPTKITDLPEKLLMSGINLPGTCDIENRRIILCYAECIARSGLNKYEIAKLLLYYASIPSFRSENRGFTILLLAETDQDNKILETLDKSALLITNHMRISRIIVWRPGINPQHKTLTSRIQVVTVSDETTLWQYIAKDQAPVSCGGSSTQHDQLEWVEFFRQAEPFIVACRSAGRALLSALSQLRHEEIPYQVTRRFLNHQCRQIIKATQNEAISKVRQEGPGIISSLEERVQWLSGSRDVQKVASDAQISFATVNKVATRLEQLTSERRDRIKDLTRLRVLQDEAEELLQWIRKTGEETVKAQFAMLRSAESVQSIKELEKNFENFQFDAMRQIDKTTDLIEESNGIKEVKGKNLKEQTNTLKFEVKGFGERLEELRERLEDASRCFQLLESCQDILEDDNKEQEDFKRLAFKSGNEKLITICEGAKPLGGSSADEDANATSTPIKSNSQIRRRSVSSYAFIYKCNHHAAGVSCNCCESDTENTVSYKLKKRYMLALQNCHCTKESLERKSSVTLDGIKEVRESVENLLEDIATDNNSGSSREKCDRCDSGVSTADNSVGEDSGYKKKLERNCSCQYCRESCPMCSANSSSTESNQDHTENQQDSIIEEGSEGFAKSSHDDIDDHYTEERRKVLPVSSNSHLYYNSSIIELPSNGFDDNTDSKTQKTLLYIMREMIQTERDYVKSLDFIIENYIPELLREDIPQALRGQRNVVFGNVEKIYEFHSQHFLRELEQCENHPLQVGQIFLKYDKRFYLYALYNKNKPKSDSLMSEYGSAFFRSKQIQLGDKMDLASYLLKPVQRMGKYALLLQQMMKACPELEADASERAQTEQDDLKQAELMVRFQLRHGNDLLAMDSIRDCDVNLKEQGRLIRQNEFLVWEGKNGKKSLRQVFLFEELILFSKARRFPDRKNLDLYIYKNSIKMTDIGLTAKIGDSPTKFEIWFRKRKPNDTFTLQSMTEDIKKAWTEELSQLLWKQAIRNREARMQEMSSMGIGNKPCLDIRPSKDQISDRSISFDQLCRTAPRFRNSIVGPSTTDTCRSVRRPHSVISMSSVSSGSTSSAGSGHTTTATNLINLTFDGTCDSPKVYHRSGTLNSQCSVESGIISDISLSHDEYPENHQQQNSQWPLEKFNSDLQTSTLTNVILEESPLNYVPDDLPVNL